MRNACPVVYQMVCFFIAKRSTRGIKVAKKPKTVLKKPKVIGKKPNAAERAKPQVKKRVSPSVATETAPRMYWGLAPKYTVCPSDRFGCFFLLERGQAVRSHSHQAATNQTIPKLAQIRAIYGFNIVTIKLKAVLNGGILYM